MKRLYLISQNTNTDYDTFDTFDSAVVVSDTPENAKLIHPAGGVVTKKYGSRTWIASLDTVTVTYLGNLNGDFFNLGDVICASFNAG